MKPSSLKCIKELEYIKLSLDSLIAMIQEEVDSKLESYESLEKSSALEIFLVDPSIGDISEKLHIPEEDKEIYIKRKKKDDNTEIVTIISTISESILIRQVAIVEKYLVDLSFNVYEHCIQGIERLPIAPNMKLDDKNKFSDCIRAVESINKNLDKNIKNLPTWKVFKKLRELRHKLAHGERSLGLSPEEANQYNKQFSIPVFIKEETELYRLNPKLSAQIEITDYFISFIKGVFNELDLPLELEFSGLNKI